MGITIFSGKRWQLIGLVVLGLLLGFILGWSLSGGSATPVFRRVRFFNASDDVIPQVEIRKLVAGGQTVLVTMTDIAANDMATRDANSDGFVGHPDVTRFEIVITVTLNGVPTPLPAIPFQLATGSFGGVSICIEKNPTAPPPHTDSWYVLAVAFHAADEDDEFTPALSTPYPVVCNLP